MCSSNAGDTVILNCKWQQFKGFHPFILMFLFRIKWCEVEAPKCLPRMLPGLMGYYMPSYFTCNFPYFSYINFSFIQFFTFGPHLFLSLLRLLSWPCFPHFRATEYTSVLAITSLLPYLCICLLHPTAPTRYKCICPKHASAL